MLQVAYSALNILFEFCQAVWKQYVSVGPKFVHNYSPLEALPDYYLNCDSAKRLWQDWRVLRRLFIRRDHSHDLLLQGQSGWLPIHGMIVNRQMLTITTDEGEKVLDLEERVVWLSRANPANTQITLGSIWTKIQQSNIGWCPV
ncbi:MAG: hypothetical protein F6K11_27835 [Leptolyngbya sp. SIO3F4]|nr:hypothetical protein [Leptolyngbya sp. SIO3F4]